MSYRYANRKKELLLDVPGFSYLPSTELRPSERHQIWDDLIKFQKEFGSEIYVQRCREKDL